MSSYLVSDTQISAMVQSAIVQGVITPPIANDVWQRVKWENMYNLSCLYGDDCPTQHTDIELNRTIVEAPLYGPVVWACIRNWQYQCMDHADFYESYAYRLMSQLRRKLERAIIGDSVENREDLVEKIYDLAEPNSWGIDSWSQITAGRSPSTTTI